MNNSIDPQKLDRFLGKKAAQEIKKAVNSGSADKLMDSLEKEDREKLEKLMKDKTARDKLLSSPQVKDLISQLLG